MKACVDGLCAVPAFNDYLRTFREAYAATEKDSEPSGVAGFFTQLVEKKISLITKHRLAFQIGQRENKAGLFHYNDSKRHERVEAVFEKRAEKS